MKAEKVDFFPTFSRFALLQASFSSYLQATGVQLTPPSQHGLANFWLPMSGYQKLIDKYIEMHSIHHRALQMSSKHFIQAKWRQTNDQVQWTIHHHAVLT